MEEDGVIARYSGALSTVAGNRLDVAIDPRHRRRRLCRQPRLQGAGRRRLPAGRLRQPVARPPRRGALGSAGRGRPARPRPARRGDALASGGRGHAFRGLRLCRRVGDRPGNLLPQQRRRHALALLDAMREAGGRDDRLLLDLRGLRRSPRPCRSARRPPRRRSTLTARPSWRSSGHCTGTPAPTACATRRCAISTPPAPIPTARSARTTIPETHLIPLVLRAALGTRRAGRDLRHRLSDAGRHRDPRLHPCDRSGRRACPGAGRSRRRAATACALNLGTGSGHSVREVIAAVERVAGRPVPRREAPRRPGDPPELVADPALARERLGWRPRAFRSRHDRPHRAGLGDPVAHARRLTRRRTAPTPDLADCFVSGQEMTIISLAARRRANLQTGRRSRQRIAERSRRHERWPNATGRRGTRPIAGRAGLPARCRRRSPATGPGPGQILFRRRAASISSRA